CIIRVHAAIVCWCPSTRGTAWAHTADQVAPFRRQVALGGLFGAQRVEPILRAIERWGQQSGPVAAPASEHPDPGAATRDQLRDQIGNEFVVEGKGFVVEPSVTMRSYVDDMRKAGQSAVAHATIRHNFLNAIRRAGRTQPGTAERWNSPRPMP